MRFVDKNLKKLIQVSEECPEYEKHKPWLENVLKTWTFEKWAKYVEKEYMILEDYKNNIYNLQDKIEDKTLGEYELALDYYGGSNSLIYLRHKNKNCNFYEFWIKYSLFLINGAKCPICSKRFSKGEYAIEKYLLNKKVEFKKQYSFSDLVGKTGKKLRFDFGVLNKDFTLKFLIEFDGVYHFKTTKKYDIERLKEQKYRDELKNQYCRNKNIDLVRISCFESKSSEYKDLLKIIEEKLNGKI